MSEFSEVGRVRVAGGLVEHMFGLFLVGKHRKKVWVYSVECGWLGWG